MVVKPTSYNVFCNNFRSGSMFFNLQVPFKELQVTHKVRHTNSAVWWGKTRWTFTHVPVVTINTSSTIKTKTKHHKPSKHLLFPKMTLELKHMNRCMYVCNMTISKAAYATWKSLRGRCTELAWRTHLAAAQLVNIKAMARSIQYVQLTAHSQSSVRKRWVFSRCLNVHSEVTHLTDSGSRFHTRGPAAAKARSP